MANFVVLGGGFFVARSSSAAKEAGTEVRMVPVVTDRKTYSNSQLAFAIDKEAVTA
jgi:hypothetical protein